MHNDTLTAVFGNPTQIHSGTTLPIAAPATPTVNLPTPPTTPAKIVRSRGEPASTDVDAFPGTTWHGRIASDAGRVATITAAPYLDTDNVRRVGIRSNSPGKPPRNTTPRLATFLEEFTRDAADKQDPFVLAAEAAANAPAAAAQPVSTPAAAEPTTAPQNPSDATASVSDIRVGQKRSGPGVQPTHVEVVAVNNSTASQWRVVGNGGYEAWHSAERIREWWPTIEHGVVAGQVRESAGKSATGSIPRIRVTAGHAPADHFVIEAGWPSIVPVAGWRATLPADEIARLWPQVRPANIGILPPEVQASSAMLPASLTQQAPHAPTAPTPIALGQTREAPSMRPVRVVGYDSATSIYLVQCFDVSVWPYRASNIEETYPLVTSTNSDPNACVVTGQFRDGAPGFIRRVEVKSFDTSTRRFTLVPATASADTSHQLESSLSSVLERWPTLSEVQAPIAPKQQDPRIKIGETRVCANNTSNDARVVVESFDVDAGRYHVRGDGPLEVLISWDLTADEIVARWPTVSRKQWSPVQVKDAIVHLLRIHHATGFAIWRIAEIVVDDVGCDATDVLKWGDDLIARNEIHLRYEDGKTAWVYGAAPVVAPPAPPAPIDADEALLAALDGYTAGKIRSWCKSTPHDIHTMYGIGDANTPLSPAQVIRVLALRSSGWRSGNITGLVL